MNLAALKPPRVRPGDPEWRAALFGQAIAYAAPLAGPICPHALHRHLKGIVGHPDEGSGAELLDVVLMLIQVGLFTVNTTNEAGGPFFGEDTVMTVAPVLTAYLYGGPVDDMEDEA